MFAIENFLAPGGTTNVSGILSEREREKWRASTWVFACVSDLKPALLLLSSTNIGAHIHTHSFICLQLCKLNSYKFILKLPATQLPLLLLCTPIQQSIKIVCLLGLVLYIVCILFFILFHFITLFAYSAVFFFLLYSRLLFEVNALLYLLCCYIQPVSCHISGDANAVSAANCQVSPAAGSHIQ